MGFLVTKPVIHSCGLPLTYSPGKGGYGPGTLWQCPDCHCVFELIDTYGLYSWNHNTEAAQQARERYEHAQSHDDRKRDDSFEG